MLASWKWPTTRGICRTGWLPDGRDVSEEWRCREAGPMYPSANRLRFNVNKMPKVYYASS